MYHDDLDIGYPQIEEKVTLPRLFCGLVMTLYINEGFDNPSVIYALVRAVGAVTKLSLEESKQLVRDIVADNHIASDEETVTFRV